MGMYQAKVSGIIDSPPEKLYAILSDYHQGHPFILPAGYFTGLTVTEGGQGEGTHIIVAMDVFGSKVEYQMKVTEPEPGRILVEEDESAGLITTFTLDPLDGGRKTQVTITTKARTSPGLKGAVEKLVNPAVMRRIYRQELGQLAAVAGNGRGAIL